MKHPVFSNAPFFLLDLYEQELGFCDKIQDYSCKSLKDQDKLFSSKELTLPKATPLKSSMLELNKTSTMEHYNTAVIPYSIFCRLLNNLKRKQMFMKTFQILRVDLLMI